MIFISLFYNIPLIITGNVVVKPNEETNVEERYMGVNIETCLHNSDVQILVAILSAGVAVLLIFSVVITVCLLRKSNRKQVVDPDLQISGSSVHTLYIPRAKMNAELIQRDVA